MTGEVGESDGALSGQAEMSLSHKRAVDHTLAVLYRWRQLLLGTLAGFGVIWTIAEASSYFLSASFRGPRFYFVAVVASFAIASAGTVRAYLADFPAGYEDETAEIRRIAQLQRPLWEFELARALLTHSLRDLDDELSALAAGRVYVPVATPKSSIEYAQWVGQSSDSLGRMADVAGKLLVLDFPSALSAPRSDRPMAIRQVVRRIEDLYAGTVAFEKSMRATLPPEEASELYELQLGWSEPIRDGVQQLFEFLDEALSVDPKRENQRLAYSIVMGEPENTEAFCREYRRVLGA